MEITEIRIKLMESSEDRLRAFCSITIDGCFVVRDLKIIDGSSGPFVAMPSRKLTGHCSRCHHKNHLRASYCNHCGYKLSFDLDGALDSPQKLYADVAHPINSACRELIQGAVIDEFQSELKRCEQPGYRSRYDDEFDDAGEEVETAMIDPPHSSASPPKQRNASNRRAERRPGERGGASRGETAKHVAAPIPPDDQTSTDNSTDGKDGFGAGIF